MRFYLGTHRAEWLGRVDVPLFVSRVHLAKRRSLPRAMAPWALDSGGFTALSKLGEWTVTVAEYAAEVDRYAAEVGSMAWAAPMDWMCEPKVLAVTGLSVEEHQRRTVDNLLALRSLRPDLPWVPVLQGWEMDDYRRCVELYERAGVDLTTEPVVGLGTVCRRQDTREVGFLVADLMTAGLRLHGFGVKLTGLHRFGWALASADSMAWSHDARWIAFRGEPAPCGGDHKSCANCPAFAVSWRERVQGRLGLFAAP